MKSATRFAVLAAAMFAVSARPALAQERKGNPAEEAALLKKAEAFVEAFHKGDAKAVAAFWTPDGDYTDQDGRYLKGRDAIEKAFTEFFAAGKGLKLRIDSDSLRFVTPDVAVEDGATAVIAPDGSPPSRARYTIVHVKQGGQWYLSSVRDSVYVPETNYANLRGLEWIIGAWASEPQGGEVARVAFEWTENQNFIVSLFTTSFKNITLAGGKEWIGWDPVAKKVRSWMFDLEGGFGEGSWTSEGDKLVIKTHSVRRDGTQIDATNIVTRIDADTVSWQSKERTAGGKPLPDVKEIKMKRQTQ